MPSTKDDARRMHEMYEAGDIAGVWALVSSGVDPNARDVGGVTMLHKAIYDEMLVKALINAGADVNVRDNLGATPLHRCAYVDNKEEDVVARSLAHLLAAGAATNVLDKAGIAPLHLAVERGNYNIMRQLLENDNDPADANVRDLDDGTSLLRASSLDAVTTRILIDAGADVNACDTCGYTPVILATIDWRPGGCLNAIRMLLDAGADVNAVTDNGRIALHFSIHERSEQLVALLIERGADVNASDIEDTTPLHCAAKRNSVKCMRMLLDAGADVDVMTDNGRTALHLSSFERSEQLVALLIERGAGVNMSNAEGIMPLHYAAETGLVKPIRMLLKAGADVNAKCRKENWTALHYAMKCGEPRDAARQLIWAGADVNAASDKGWTPIHALLDEYQQLTGELENDVAMTLEVVRLLLVNGADVNAVRNDGATPLFAACEITLYFVFPRSDDGMFDETQSFYDARNTSNV